MEDGWRCTTLCGEVQSAWIIDLWLRYFLVFLVSRCLFSLPLASPVCTPDNTSNLKGTNIFFSIYRRNSEPLLWFLKVENEAFPLDFLSFALSSECDRLLSLPWSRHSSLVDRRHKFPGIRSILISYLGLGIICCKPYHLLLELCIGRQEG